MSTLITEAGDTLKAETVAGIASASTLNDISVVTIYKETFETNPASRGWLVGTDWQFINNRMEII